MHVCIQYRRICETPSKLKPKRNKTIQIKKKPDLGGGGLNPKPCGGL
jgi:hypothetical protein